MLKQFPLRYLVHGYAGSLEGFELLSRLDTVFTISSRIHKDDKLQLLDAIVKRERFLFETDITQYYVKAGEENPLLRLCGVVSETERLTGVSSEQMQAVQAESFAYLFGEI